MAKIVRKKIIRQNTSVDPNPFTNSTNTIPMWILKSPRGQRGKTKNKNQMQLHLKMITASIPKTHTEPIETTP